MQFVQVNINKDECDDLIGDSVLVVERVIDGLLYEGRRTSDGELFVLAEYSSNAVVYSGFDSFIQFFHWLEKEVRDTKDRYGEFTYEF